MTAARSAQGEGVKDAAAMLAARPTEEVVWLIACKRDGALIGWLGLWDNENYGWTLDPNKAIRFARQKDADMMFSNWEVEDGDILTSEEHIWL